jgi:hypothetical protein
LRKTVLWWCHSSLSVGVQGGREERIRNSQTSRTSCRTRGTHGFLFLQQRRRRRKGDSEAGSCEEGADIGLVSKQIKGCRLMAGMYITETERRGLSGMIQMSCTFPFIVMMGVTSTLQVISER